MGILVVLLIAAWGLVLGPALLQSLGGSSPLDTEAMFRRSLRAMGRRPRYGTFGARNILVPPKSPFPLGQASAAIGAPARHVPSAAERRRRNLTYLAVFIISTFILGLLPPLRFLLVFNLIADILLIAYLGLALYLAVWPPVTERELVPAVDREVAPQAAREVGAG